MHSAHDSRQPETNCQNATAGVTLGRFTQRAAFTVSDEQQGKTFLYLSHHHVEAIPREQLVQYNRIVEVTANRRRH
jgi:hypothetical protein